MTGVSPRSNEEIRADLDEYLYGHIGDRPVAAHRLAADVPALLVEREALTRVRALAEVVAQLQPATPDTHDRDVSWLELLEAIEGDE